MKFYLKKIFSRTPLTHRIFFIFSDIVFIILSVYLSFILRFEGVIPVQYFPAIERVIVLALMFCLPIFYFSKLYSFSWSYVSTNELVSLARAVILSFLFLGLSIFISKDYQSFIGFPRSTIFISSVLIFIFCGGIRFAKRIYLHLFNKTEEREEQKRTLIVGAGDAGEQILRSILISRKSSYSPVGFVDDSPIKQGVIIHGFGILGKIGDIPSVVANNRIEEIIIALPSASSKTIKRAVELGRTAGVKKIKVVPSIAELIKGEVSVGNIREVEVEDLLGRDPVFIETESIENFIKNKIILITGAAGSIGSELSRQISKFKPSLLLLLDQDETGIFNISKELRAKFPYLKIESLVLDICDEEEINRIFSGLKPTIVFHAAAYKHVPLMESQPREAIKNNVFGTKIVAETALKYGAEKFIFISTDKAINPTSVMGATKRVGEMICQVLNQKNHTKFVSVRFGNVLGSRGSVIPIFKEQIKKRGQIEVTHPEMKRYFMSTAEACLLVMQSAEMGQGGEVFVLDMGKPVKILDLAKEMIRLSGFEPDKDIPIVFTGIRPGEKLFEEILSAEEGISATRNQKIFIAKLSEVNEENLKLNLAKLKEAAENSEKEKIKIILKGFITHYNPNVII